MARKSQKMNIVKNLKDFGIDMKTLIFFNDIKKNGVVQYVKYKHYHIESEDQDSLFVKSEFGDICPMHKANCNILYMINEECYNEGND